MFISNNMKWEKILRKIEREREGGGIGIIYSFRPLPLMKRVQVDHLPVHTIIIPISKKTNKYSVIEL